LGGKGGIEMGWDCLGTEFDILPEGNRGFVISLRRGVMI
jgi:hypothetical protein